MTPEEWERCRDVRKMLAFLRGSASARKVRLFGCACCRRIWHLLGEPDRQAIEITERYLEGEVAEAEWLAAVRGADGPARSAADRRPARAGSTTARLAAERAAGDAYERLRQATGTRAVRRIAQALSLSLHEAEDPRDAYLSVEAGERSRQAAILRDILGSPLRPPPAVAPAVLAYNGGAARRLAESIHDGRRFDDLPVLADLLEEAGLTDAALLGHLRGPGPHALGCHALDLLLGKE
jgi:hypothetical protein